MKHHRIAALPLVAIAVAVLAGCGGQHASALLAPDSPGALGFLSAVRSTTDELPPFDPTNFVAGVDHPYFPLVPGSTSTFDGGGEHIVVEVLPETKSILGITATVVRDRVYIADALIEDTFDWYAQDRAGNVWYLGEAVKNYEGGVLVDTNGSWEAGQNGATAGINMLAHPRLGDSYQQEYAVGVAEDKARVRSVEENVVVPYGTFAHCIKTLEWTPLEPSNRGYKYYAEGVGLVLEASARGGRERTELVSVTGP